MPDTTTPTARRAQITHQLRLEAADHIDQAQQCLEADLHHAATAHATTAHATTLLALANLLEDAIDAVRDLTGPECVMARETRQIDTPDPASVYTPGQGVYAQPRIVDEPDVVYAPVVPIKPRPDHKDLR